MKTESHTYTVGRSEGVVYPRDFPHAPTVPQLAALYDQQAQRIAQLERQCQQWRQCAERLEQVVRHPRDDDFYAQARSQAMDFLREMKIRAR